MNIEDDAKKWFGDSVRLDDYAPFIWTKPDHRLILSRADDLEASNPNMKAYFKFAVNAINAKLTGNRIKPSTLPFQEFKFDSVNAIISSGSQPLFDVRSWGEYFYHVNKNHEKAEQLQNAVGEWITDALNKAQFQNSN